MLILKYPDNMLCCKWYDNKGVLLLASIIEGMDICSTVQRSMKGSSSKTPNKLSFCCKDV